MRKSGTKLNILARATSIKEALDVLKKGTLLWKARNKGGIFGIKFYRRNFRLDVPNLALTYTPNKNGVNSAFGSTNCAAPIAEGGIELNDICEIRCGHGTDTFNSLVKDKKPVDLAKVKVTGNEFVDLRKEYCFSIIFKDHRPPLDLVAEEKEIRDYWVDALTHLVVTIRSLGQQKEYELYLRRMFKEADKNGNNVLAFDECKALVKQLNVKLDSDVLMKLFEEANKTRAEKVGEEEALDETEFISFYYSLLRKPELDQIFIRYMTKKGPPTESVSDYRMMPTDLQKFLKDEQKLDIDEEECSKFIEAYEPSAKRESLSIEGFTQFMLFSKMQSVFDEAQCNLVYQDMDQPLSHYWIASSHNTYLLGNQVTGESSVDAYIKALKEGCRCVELDCWDGEDGEPIIYHGWTLTSKIPFSEVMKDAIAPFAFKVSEYPLILSIENHCSVEQQDRMADIMVQVLGNKLYKDPVDESLDALPSPESLKNKILIKAKRLPPGSDADAEVVEEDDPDDERDEKRKQKPKKISKKLSDLVNYITAVHFPGFEEEGKFYHMSSFGESKTMGYLEDPEKAKKFVQYNTRQLSRIYPAGARQDSSNYDPIEPWNAGCQIVALNYQTFDKETFRNRARFADNGGCGYILKPDFLTKPDPEYSPLDSSAIAKKEAMDMAVKIVSGQHLPRPDGSLDGEVIDPYVKVRIRGHRDENKDEFETEPVRNNGFNPVWNDDFNFHVKIPSLAFIEFRVHDHSKSGKDQMIGAFTCPLSMIQEGYRRVPLKSYSGKDLAPACLLVQILCEDAGEDNKSS